MSGLLVASGRKSWECSMECLFSRSRGEDTPYDCLDRLSMFSRPKLVLEFKTSLSTLTLSPKPYMLRPNCPEAADLFKSFDPWGALDGGIL